MSFDATTPADARAAYLVDDDIRANFAGIQKGDHWTTGTEPAYKEEGCPWYDSTNDVFKVYNGTSWDSLLEDNSTSYYDYGTSGTAGTAKAKSALKVCYGTRTVSGSSTATVAGLPFTSATSYIVVLTFGSATSQDGNASYARNSASQFTITNDVTISKEIGWIAIGT